MGSFGMFVPCKKTTSYFTSYFVPRTSYLNSMAEKKHKIKAGIVGGAGYTGGELIRLLIHHPDVSVSFIHSRSNAGKPVYSIHQDLLGDTELVFTDDTKALNDGSIDVLFLCLGHGESKKFVSANKISDNIKIIDLANDFRLKDQS